MKILGTWIFGGVVVVSAFLSLPWLRCARLSLLKNPGRLGDDLCSHAPPPVPPVGPGGPWEGGWLESASVGVVSRPVWLGILVNLGLAWVLVGYDL